MIRPLRWYERVRRWFSTLKYTNAIVCDRCGRITLGWPPLNYMTMGYYHDWPHTMNPGEVDVCDACMWADPRYQAIYGVHQ